MEFTEVSFPGMSPGSVSLESGNTSRTAGMGTSVIMGSSRALLFPTLPSASY